MGRGPEEEYPSELGIFGTWDSGNVDHMDHKHV